mmetsp:Transcript_22500/g.57632  ORF Transcript_22500/g.57632 Transcript_22500/m.57632 type:complete len:228 (-) Transcript_22500:48-731(-)|eukprot:jgi/Tetstr1/426795/TSEL_017010.t1
MVVLHTPRRRFYTPYEVAMHSSPDDCWVSFLGNVFDLTALIAENEGSLAEPLIQAAGEDISHWFDPETVDVKRHVDPLTQLPCAYTPMGRFIHVPPNEPTNDWSTIIGKPWWQDHTLRVGALSTKLRCVRIKNVLTSQEETLEVPEEETIVEIRERYLMHNWHAKSYTWKAIRMRDGKWKFDELDMNLTLDENGVLDEVPEFESLDVPTDYYIPVLHVYWNDDLTVA